MIERFYDPNNGEVLIDGQPIKSINLKFFRQQIGYVGQEPVLLNTSIKKNLMLGKPDATDSEVIESLKSSRAWEFVSQYPETINLVVGNAGG